MDKGTIIIPENQKCRSCNKDATQCCVECGWAFYCTIKCKNLDSLKHIMECGATLTCKNCGKRYVSTNQYQGEFCTTYCKGEFNVQNAKRISREMDLQPWEIMITPVDRSETSLDEECKSDYDIEAMKKESKETLTKIYGLDQRFHEMMKLLEEHGASYFVKKLENMITPIDRSETSLDEECTSDYDIEAMKKESRESLPKIYGLDPRFHEMMKQHGASYFVKKVGDVAQDTEEKS